MREKSFIVLLLGSILFTGCNQGSITRKNITGGPYSEQKELPVVLAEHESGSGYMGSISVTGTRKAALKWAAKMGARAVKLRPVQLEMEAPVYDWSDGQRYIGTETQDVPGHDVTLYRNR